LLWNTSDISWVSTSFHKNATNINPIATRGMGDARVDKTAYSRYRLCCNTMKTQILSLNETWRTRNLEPRSGSNLAPNMAGWGAVRIITLSNLTSSVCWPFLSWSVAG
jgi:hypothetical protein